MLARLNCHGHNCPLWSRNWLWLLRQINALWLSTALAGHGSTRAVISATRDLKNPNGPATVVTGVRISASTWRKHVLSKLKPVTKPPLESSLHLCLASVCPPFLQKPSKSSSTALLSPPLPFYPPLHTISSRFKIPHCRADGFVIRFGYSWQTDTYFDTATNNPRQCSSHVTYTVPSSVLHV